MEIEVSNIIYVDINSIIEMYGIDAETKWKVIVHAVEDFIAGMDDYEFESLKEHVEEIANGIRDIVGEQLSLY